MGQKGIDGDIRQFYNPSRTSLSLALIGHVTADNNTLCAGDPVWSRDSETSTVPRVIDIQNEI